MFRHVVVLAEELNYRRAAARLFVSPATLGEHVRRLESWLGTTLIDRSNRRRIALTPAGEVFVREARIVLSSGQRRAPRPGVARRPVPPPTAGRPRLAPASLGEALSGRAGRLARSRRGGDSRTARMAVLGTSAGDRTQAVLDTAGTLLPGWDLQPVAVDFAGQIDALRSGSADVATVYPPFSPERIAGLALHVVRQERRVVLFHSDHALRRAPVPLQVTDLLPHRFIRFAEDVDPVWADFWSLGPERRAAGTEHAEGPVVTDLPSAMRAAEEGALVVVTAETRDQVPDDLVLRHVPELSPADVALAWRPDTPAELLAALAAAHVREALLRHQDAAAGDRHR